jgi:hypothetical protein
VKDAFLMMLCAFPHYDSWEKYALDFGFKTSTFENMIQKMIGIVERVLKLKLVQTISMTNQRVNNQLFSSYSYALYATDVKFHHFSGYQEH